MLKDIRLHGSVNPAVDFFATLAGENLLPTQFYEVRQGPAGTEYSFFLQGQFLRVTPDGVHFSGNGGVVSEYMFGSTMPLQDLGHKEVRNRLVLFGAYASEGGLRFTASVDGFEEYGTLFMEGNALCNYFFLVKSPWPYSVRRTQEVLLKTLGRVLKRSENPGLGRDSEFLGELHRELAEPAATILLLRLAHIPNARFHGFVSDYYGRMGEWGEPEETFAAKLAEEVDVEEYQRRRIAIDILYKDPRNRPIVDEYKDILLRSLSAPLGPSSLARLNSLRTLATRHSLPPTLFGTLDGMAPSPSATAQTEPDFVRETREILQGLFLESRAPAEAVGPGEVVRLLRNKQKAQQLHDNAFEQVLLDTGRMLDERTVDSEDFRAFEVFSDLITYFDRLDAAEATLSHLGFMEGATAPPEKVRSLLGTKRAFDALETDLFDHLLVRPLLINDYALRYGKRKVTALCAGLENLEGGERTVQDVSGEVEAIVREETLLNHAYQAVRERLRLFYFNLSNPSHAGLLKREVAGELKKKGLLEGDFPAGAFESVLDEVQRETEFVNNLLPALVETGDEAMREAFVKESGLDRCRLEELERQYREAHGLEPEGHAMDALFPDP